MGNGKDYADDPSAILLETFAITRLRRAFSGVDYVVHATTKIVPTLSIILLNV